MRRYCVLFFVLLIEETFALSSCRHLEIYKFVGLSQPVSGNSLTYCHSESLQCCTEKYIIQLKQNLTKELKLSVQKDIETTIKRWSDGYNTITKVFLDQFITKFVSAIPFPHSLVSDASLYLNNTVKPNLMYQLNPDNDSQLSYNFGRYVFNMSATLVDLFTQSTSLSPTKQQCLDEVLHDHINLDAIKTVGETFSEMQRIFLSLKKIKKFLASFNISSLYTPSDQCVRAMMVQYCPICVRNIPKMCEINCVSIATACQSPIYDNLRDQLDALWNVTHQLLDELSSLMSQTLLIDAQNILPLNSILSLAQHSAMKCNVDLLALLGIGKRSSQTDDIDFVPAITKMSSIAFVFDYSYVGPAFCRFKSSPKNCWNGSSVVADGSAVAYNTTLSIDDHQNQTVYNFDIWSFYQQAVEAGTVVISFLQSSYFIDTLSSNISVPVVPSLTLPPTIATPTIATPTIATPTTPSVVNYTEEPTINLPTIPKIIIIYPSSSYSLNQSNNFFIILTLLLAMFLILHDWI